MVSGPYQFCILGGSITHLSNVYLVKTSGSPKLVTVKLIRVECLDEHALQPDFFVLLFFCHDVGSDGDLSRALIICFTVISARSSSACRALRRFATTADSADDGRGSTPCNGWCLLAGLLCLGLTSPFLLGWGRSADLAAADETHCIHVDRWGSWAAEIEWGSDLVGRE